MHMNRRTLLGSVALIVVFLIGTYFVLNGSTDGTDAALESIDTRVVVTPEESELVSDVSTEGEVVLERDGSVPPRSSDESVPKTPKTSGYTLAEVSAHSDAASCWSIIDGQVYDLTEFLDMHPGGKRNILKICGKDGTDMFMGKHGGDAKPEAALANFLVGAYSG
jgi:predicted heme/steroid binding protein